MCDWISDSLTQVLGEDMSDYTEYVLQIDNEVDFEEYMRNLLDFTNTEHIELYENIRCAKFDNQGGNQSKARQGSSNGANGNSSGKKVGKQDSPPPPATSSASNDNSYKKQKKAKKFTKFQMNELQKGYLKEGRIPCDCQATKHNLINNCLECGRIVCEQEGSGPCFFCENMVCTNEELDILNSETKQANALYRALVEKKKSDTWKKAMQERNKMLEFDQNCTQRTKIIDDEHDWFDINNRWSSKKDREKAAKKLSKDHEQKYGSRLGARKITLDLLGHQAVEEGFVVDDEEDTLDYEEQSAAAYKPQIPDIDSVLESLSKMNSNFQPKKFGVFQKSKHDQTGEEEEEEEDLTNNYVIQDKTYLEMRDMGMCLSMHQPWASLLLTGIKKHEGRTWYTPHRGKLWIAAASKPVNADTIAECERFYIEYYKGHRIQFPTDYPTGCLLGCLLVEDCLSQEEYQKQYPQGESESPYVLICSSPQMLPVAYAMQGDHKIYRLKKQIHKMACDALLVRRRF